MIPPFASADAWTLVMSTGPCPWGRAGSIGSGLAGVPVERLATPRGVEAQQSHVVVSDDIEGMGKTARRDGDPTSSDSVVGSVDVRHAAAYQAPAVEPAPLPEPKPES